MRLVEECRHETGQNNLAGYHYWRSSIGVARAGAVDAAIPGFVAMTKQERELVRLFHPDTNGGDVSKIPDLARLASDRKKERMAKRVCWCGCGRLLQPGRDMYYSQLCALKDRARRRTPIHKLCEICGIPIKRGRFCWSPCYTNFRPIAVTALAALWLACFPVLGLESPRGAETFFKGKSVNLVWDPSPTAGVKYRVYWSKDGRFWYREETTNTVMTVIGLARNTTYRFKATAFVGNNESGPSNVLVYKTPKR